MAKKNKYADWTKEELIKHVTALDKRKKYGLVWDEEKTIEKFEADAEGKFPVLKEVKSKEIKTEPKQPTHILIEGDNYHALSVLSYTHEKKIDVIYIDPPYNKGNINVRDFVYNDHIVDSEDPYRHSKWLSFMKKRLSLAHRLLKDTGLIFISIDDTEMARLKILLDQIFLENNFFATLIWRGMHTVRNSSKDFNKNTEYILCYSKSKNRLIETGKNETYLRIFRDKTDDYPNDDNDGNGPYKLDPIYARNFYTPYNYTFKNGVKWSAPKGNYPRYSIESLKDLDTIDAIVFTGKDPKAKRYLKDVQEGVPPSTLLPSEIVGFNKDGTSELSNLFNGEKVFDQPKPVSLIKFILSISSKKLSKNKYPIVLDFFAGSATTGHAVLDLNKNYKSKIQFILCTNNENNICREVSYPRIEKVMNGYVNQNKDKVAGIGGNLKYYITKFVPQEPTDKNKELLTKEAIEMLCLKENVFDVVSEKEEYKIYKNDKKYLGIILDQSSIDDFKKDVKKYNKQINVYVFSLTDEDFSAEFSDLKKKVKVCSIPEAILRVYRRIFK